MHVGDIIRVHINVYITYNILYIFLYNNYVLIFIYMHIIHTFLSVALIKNCISTVTTCLNLSVVLHL